MRAGLHLFHSSTIAMGSAGVNPGWGDHGHDGDQWRPAESSSEGERRTSE